MFVPSLDLAMLGDFMGMDGLVVLIIGILIFGRKLPDFAKNIGKVMVEFKQGVSDGKERDEMLLVALIIAAVLSTLYCLWQFQAVR